MGKRFHAARGHRAFTLLEVALIVAIIGMMLLIIVGYLFAPKQKGALPPIAESTPIPSAAPNLAAAPAATPAAVPVLVATPVPTLAPATPAPAPPAPALLPSTPVPSTPAPVAPPTQSIELPSQPLQQPAPLFR